MSAKIHLLEAPLMPPRQDCRLSLVEAMANVLLEQNAYGNRQDAIRALFWEGSFKSLDVVRWVDDARQVAFQTTVDVVATEMRKS